MKRSFFAVAVAAGIMLCGITGCVTEQYVKDQIASVDTQIAEVRKKAEANQTEIASLKKSVKKHSRTVQEAMSRAEEAHKLAEGKFLYEATISGDSVLFGFDESSLSGEAKSCLDILAGVLKDENKNLYMEIQGHTDNTGPEDHNLVLGQARAEVVMRYLHMEEGVPLHRMNAFSYGESKPIVENDTPANRAKNRRVTIVVME